MKHILLIAAVSVSSAAANAQTTRVYAKHLQASEKLQLKTRTITDFSISLFSADSNSDTKIPTAKAVADFVRARAGGGVGGAVSSVFGRTGAVSANAGDYSAFYANLSHTHPLNDLLQSGAALGQVPVWTLSGWQPGTVSGGGSADSSWSKSETGIAPNMIGYLVNSTLPSLPSGWADVTPDASVTFSSKMIVTGGTTGTTSAAGNTGTSTVYTNRVEMGYYPYSKMRYAFTVVPQDKTGTSYGLALHFKSNSLNFSTGTRIKFDLSSNADSGRIIIYTDFGSELMRSASLVFAATDTIDIKIDRDFWKVTPNMYNRRTSKYVDVVYNGGFGTGGMGYLGLLGGTQHITSAKVEGYDLKDGAAITFIGDSQFFGAGATSEEKSAVLNVVRGNKSKASSLSNGSLTLSAAVTSHVPAAIALNNPVIVSLGYNDRRDLATDTTTLKTRLDAVIDPLVAAGLPVWITTLVPTSQNNGTLNNNFDLAIINYCAANGIPVIRIDSILKKPGDVSTYKIKENYLGLDEIHWSDSGQIVGAQKIIQIVNQTLPSLFKDTISPVKLYNLPTGEVNMNRLVVDNQGNVKKVPATTFDGIYNAANYAGNGTVAQGNSSFHISGMGKTDSSFQTLGFVGRIGFNNNGRTTYGNLNITDAAPSGLTQPQGWDIFNGVGNIKIVASSANKPRNAMTGTINGNNNSFFNAHFTSTVTGNDINAFGTYLFSPTSASSVLAMGAQGARGITTGSRVISFITTNSAASVYTSTLSDFIHFGELTTTDAYVNNDIVFSTNFYAPIQRIWLGGRTNGLNAPIQLHFAGRDGTNSAGVTASIYAPRGTGTGATGKLMFKTWDSGSSGPTIHSTENTEITVDRDIVTFDAVAKTNFGIETKYTSTATSITLNNTHHIVNVTADAQTITLPTAVGITGRTYTIKLSATGTCTIATTSSQTIDGSTTYTLASQNKYVTVVSAGTSWIVTNNN